MERAQLDETFGCSLTLWQYPCLKKKDRLAQNYTQRMMQPLDVEIKWEAVRVSIWLVYSCYGPMSGDNISPPSLLELSLEKHFLHPHFFLRALSQNVQSTSMCFNISCCGLTLCHG